MLSLYNQMLELTQKHDIELDFEYLQTFEFCLAEIKGLIKKKRSGESRGKLSETAT